MERFDQYMERCLYGPNGFYSSGRGVAGGRRGDFITSPEVGPLFGVLIGRLLDKWWYELGCPDPFVVIDCGSGPGSLVRSVERAAPDCSEVWNLCEFDRALSGLNGERLPLDGSVVVANELLDNIPFRIVGQHENGAWFEVFVAEGRESLVEVDDPGVEIKPGCRAPLVEQASSWVSNVLAGGVARLALFDYGALTTVELADRGGWLRTYREHQKGADPYVEPGAWDITTDVPVDQLPPPRVIQTQAEFLAGLGLGDLVAEGRSYWEANAATPNVQALMMRSRTNEAAALTDVAGLGSWLVLDYR